MRFFCLLAFWLATLAPSISFAATKVLISAATSTGAGLTQPLPVGLEAKTFHAYGQTSSSTGACVVSIEGSSDNSHWVTLGGLSLALATTGDTDGLSLQMAWPYIRGNVISISGTGAACSLSVSW